MWIANVSDCYDRRMVVGKGEKDAILVIDPDRPPPIRVILPLLVVQTLQLSQVTFIPRCFQLEQPPPGHLDDRNGKPQPMGLRRTYAGKAVVGELDPHASLM